MRLNAGISALEAEGGIIPLSKDSFRFASMLHAKAGEPLRWPDHAEAELYINRIGLRCAAMGRMCPIQRRGDGYVWVDPAPVVSPPIIDLPARCLIWHGKAVRIPALAARLFDILIPAAGTVPWDDLMLRLYPLGQPKGGRSSIAVTLCETKGRLAERGLRMPVRTVVGVGLTLDLT